MAAAKSKKLNSAEVDVLINALIDSGNVSYISLLEFAVKVNGAEFKKPPAKKAKAMTMAVAKKAVLEKFECKTVTELRKNKTFSMSMTGEEITLKTKADWMRLYRRWVSVPESVCLRSSLLLGFRVRCLHDFPRVRKGMLESQ